MQERKPQTRPNHNKQKVDTKVYALGGLNEVGKNMYCIEHANELIIIDAGVRFAGDSIPGVDYIIPDFTYLVMNKKKIKSLIITHGHEDHIGGIPFLLQTVDIPVIYASRLAKQMIIKKLDEKKLTNRTVIEEINDESQVRTKHFNIGFFRTNHSIPESLGIIINTPNGRVVTTGDFKFDFTPVGADADLQKMAYLGASGVSLLLSDSTNAEVPGFTMSEKRVSQNINEIFRKTHGRIIIATFASNVHRVQQIIEAAVKFDRKILIFGRSMINVINIGRKLGHIQCPESSLISANEAKHVHPSKLLIICTGSQGEPLAALSRIADGTHQHVRIKPGDTVLFSSSPIPGNADSVNRVVNKLTRAGANVLTNSALNNIHTSGHASQEEQKLMLLLIKPKFFMPVHGEYRMLKIHTSLAESVGIPKDRSFICSNGDTLILRDGVVEPGGRIQAGEVYVDGDDVSGVKTAVIRDRMLLSEDGVVAVMIAMDSRVGKLLSRPMIVSRGYVYMKDHTDMIREAEEKVKRALETLLEGKTTFNEIKNTARDVLGSYFYQKTKRNPMIIPVVMNKK